MTGEAAHLGARERELLLMLSLSLKEFDCNKFFSEANRGEEKRRRRRKKKGEKDETKQRELSDWSCLST